MKKFPTRLFVASGLILFLAGFVYGSIYAGIPYQDPTPEMSANFEFHTRLSSAAVALGIGVPLIGFVGGALKHLFKKLGDTLGPTE